MKLQIKLPIHVEATPAEIPQKEELKEKQIEEIKVEHTEIINPFAPKTLGYEPIYPRANQSEVEEKDEDSKQDLLNQTSIPPDPSFEKQIQEDKIAQK